MHELKRSTQRSMTVRALEQRRIRPWSASAALLCVLGACAPTGATSEPADGFASFSDGGALDEKGLPSSTYEAESCTATNGCGQATKPAGFTGTGFMDFGGNGTWIEWNNIAAPEAGIYALGLRYANAGTGGRTGVILVNGQTAGSTPFAGTGGWDQWRTESIQVSLRRGSNTIRVLANTGAGGPNLDSMSVTAKDLCPADPNKTEAGTCGCGVPEGSCSVVSTCVEAAENTKASLACPSGQSIRSIDFASYGVPTGSCTSGLATSSCHAQSSLQAVEAACLNKASCEVLASNATFADPCPGRYKKLAVTYSCEASTPVSITVDRTSPSTLLNSTFAGFSYEKGALSTNLFNPGNTALIGLFKALGPSVLRIGGNSADNTSWNANGAGLVPGITAPSDVNRFAGFLKATGWKVIYGVNLLNSTPAVAADEAAYAAQQLGTTLLGFEIGNEPDLYVYHGHRPTTYKYPDFHAEWASFAAAIRSRVPGAPLTGPSTCFYYDYLTAPFVAEEGARINLLTFHYYVASGQDASSTTDKLLAGDWKTGLQTLLDRLRNDASGAKIVGGYRLDEANSYYGGGAPNVSNAFGSALWAIDFLFTLAQHGASGANFHGGGNGPGYTPIGSDASGKVYGPRPEYYGMYLFSLAAKGRLLSTNTTASGIRLSTFAVDASDGSTYIVILNKDSAQDARATIDLGKSVTNADVVALTAPALSSTSGVLLGGAAIGNDGSWTPTSTPKLPITGNTVTVKVAKGSAALVRAR